MYYVSDLITCYQTTSREIASQISDEIMEMGPDVMHIDFGGMLVGDMESIQIGSYSFWAHHLNKLVSALQQTTESYVKIDGYPFSYLLSREDAGTLLHTIARNWIEYRALELHNLQRYEIAIRALSGSPMVDVAQEIAGLQPAEIH